MSRANSSRFALAAAAVASAASPIFSLALETDEVVDELLHASGSTAPENARNKIPV
jgi:hypothetical protein